MVDGIITEVKWDVPIYFLRGNVYENIGSISEIRRRGTFNNNITDTNNVSIGTVDELSTNRLFIRNSEVINEEKNPPPKLHGGKTSNKRRKSRKTRKSRKSRKTRKSKRRRY
jgi:hypothetical protein